MSAHINTKLVQQAYDLHKAAYKRDCGLGRFDAAQVWWQRMREIEDRAKRFNVPLLRKGGDEDEDEDEDEDPAEAEYRKEQKDGGWGEDEGDDLSASWKEPGQSLRGLFSCSLSLCKAKKGEEVTGHRYKSRDPLPGGGWRYHYFDEQGTAQHQDYPKDHPIHAKHAELPTTAEDQRNEQAVEGALGRLPDGVKITSVQGRTYTKKGGKWHSDGADPVASGDLVDETADKKWSRGDYLRAFKAGLWAFIQGAVPGKDPHWRIRFAIKDAKQQQAKKDSLKGQMRQLTEEDAADRAAKEDEVSHKIRKQVGDVLPTAAPPEEKPEPVQAPENMSVPEMEQELAAHRQALQDVARHSLVRKELEAARKAVQAARKASGQEKGQEGGTEASAASEQLKAAVQKSKKGLDKVAEDARS